MNFIFFNILIVHLNLFLTKYFNHHFDFNFISFYNFLNKNYLMFKVFELHRLFVFVNVKFILEVLIKFLQIIIHLLFLLLHFVEIICIFFSLLQWLFNYYYFCRFKMHFNFLKAFNTLYYYYC